MDLNSSQALVIYLRVSASGFAAPRLLVDRCALETPCSGVNRRRRLSAGGVMVSSGVIDGFLRSEVSGPKRGYITHERSCPLPGKAFALRSSGPLGPD